MKVKQGDLWKVMANSLIKLSQVQVGDTFIYDHVLYVKTCQIKLRVKNYQDNCVRVDNGKSVRLNGHCLVKVVRQ